MDSKKSVPSIAVNMSPVQLREPGFVADVKTVLERTGLEPARLQLEITESMALAMDSTARVLEELHDLGVQLAVDDFGTGFSALSRLKDLPMDMVKIDRSFVRGVEADPVGKTIVSAIVTMARALDFYVVVEGVETEEELVALRRLGCDAAQGFFLGAPMPPDEVEDAMARRYPREQSGHG
jgi:EAL domain-containing protein (putative c-di-GMP-specific phosphodiesterase class I)